MDYCKRRRSLSPSLHDPGVGRLAELAERLSRRVGREIQLVWLSEAQISPVLMVDVIDHERVLVDRADLWSGSGEIYSGLHE